METVVLELSPAHLQAAGHRAETLLTWLHAHQFRISTLLFGTAVFPRPKRHPSPPHNPAAPPLLRRLRARGGDRCSQRTSGRLRRGTRARTAPPVNLLARRDTDPVARRARDHANVHWDHKAPPSSSLLSAPIPRWRGWRG